MIFSRLLSQGTILRAVTCAFQKPLLSYDESPETSFFGFAFDVNRTPVTKIPNRSNGVGNKGAVNFSG